MRSTKSFQEFKICFAKNPDSIKLETEKVVDYQPKEGGEWGNGNRLNVAKEIAKILGERSVVLLHLKQDGIYVSSDKEGKFSPTRLATESDVREGVRVGDKIPSEAWEPYIEWVPRGR